jgi:hypothetical protein
VSEASALMTEEMRRTIRPGSIISELAGGGGFFPDLSRDKAHLFRGGAVGSCSNKYFSSLCAYETLNLCTPTPILQISRYLATSLLFSKDRRLLEFFLLAVPDAVTSTAFLFSEFCSSHFFYSYGLQ